MSAAMLGRLSEVLAENKSLDKIRDEHTLWIMSQGKKGKFANL